MVKAALAEFLGTFTLVFVGIFVAAIAGGEGQGVIVAALGHGLVLIGIIYAFGKFSGAHVNPAITISLLVGGKIGVDRALIYIVAQLLGAVIAAVLANLTGATVGAGVAVSTAGQTIGSLTVDAVWSAALFEALLTFILASAVWQSAVHRPTTDLGGVAIGMTLTGCILAGGIFTGASLNIARTLGPALIAGDLSYFLPYTIGILVGAIIGGVVHGYVLTPDDPATA